MRKKIDLAKSKANKTFDEGFDEFVTWCKVRNLRPTTIKYYEDIINIWYKFCDYKTPIKNITKETVNEFIRFLQTKTKENQVTVNTVVRGVRVVLYYFMKLNYMESFMIPKLKEDRDVIETYTNEEIKILLEKPDLKKCSYIGYRNWVIINFLLATGCRARTLVNIKLQDIDIDNELITYTYTKNRRQQIIPLSNSLKQVLIEYIQYRKGEPEDYLFVNAYGQFLKVDQLGHNLNDYNRRRGVMKTGVHRWRHTFSKLWILEGGDVFRLQKILGHSSLDVVKKYVDMFTSDLQKDFNNFNPLEQLKSQKKHISIKNKI